MKRSILAGLLAAWGFFFCSTSTALEPQMTDHEAYPVFTVNPVKPNILIILDNSGSMNFNAYGPYPGDGGWVDVVNNPYTGAPYSEDETRYYGYFNPDWFYEHSGSRLRHKYRKVEYDADEGAWVVQTTDTVDAGGDARQFLDNAAIVSEALWDGNWLNWAVMRRVDIARKVIMGGKATSRTAGGTLYADEHKGQKNRYFQRRFDSTGNAAVTPYEGDRRYGVRDGYIYVDTSDNKNPYDGYARRHLRIELNPNYDPESFRDGALSGVLQRVGDEAWWGNMWFYFGTGNNQEGGFIQNAVGGNLTNIMTNLQNIDCTAWTPLGETYYVAMQYFKQEQVDTSLGYHGQATGPRNNVFDPYYQDKEFVHCAKSFVILLSDGASTRDARVPSHLRNYAHNYARDVLNLSPAALDKLDQSGTTCTDTACHYPQGGSKYLRDVALYARVNDLRPDLDGEQNLILYTIMAAPGFPENDPELLNARELLMDAARKGGPRLWDGDNDYIPDNYFEASDGYQLEAYLMAAIQGILHQAASGTAVSVLSTTAEGEGNLLQAFFQPSVSDGRHETKWVGYLQSLWVDEMGFLREDTTGDAALDITQDRVIVFDIDAHGDTLVKAYGVSVETPYPDLENDSPEAIIPLNQLQPIWEAGEVLSSSNTPPSNRKIFTSLGQEFPRHELFGGVDFNNNDSDLRDLIKPFLGVRDADAWSYLGGTHEDRAHNLIHFIRGNDTGFEGRTNIRKRTVDGKTWPLGDIVHSTPVSVSSPPDNFGLIYSDKLYQEFHNFHRNRANRETVVYVGANDGMLHAFTSWQYDDADRKFVRPNSGVGENIGTELWAYIPRALLPHLKWLPRQDYSHVYYVDMKPKIFDARIFYNTLGDPNSGTLAGDDYRMNGWGTILLGGLRFGGKAINVTDDFNGDGIDTSETFTACYFAIDISNPRSPRLLWEKAYEGLNHSLAEPAALKVGDKWFITFGSGPQTVDGAMKDNSKSRVYVADLATGEPYEKDGHDWLFEGDNQRAFMGSPAGLDKDLNFNTDAAYFGEAHQKANGDWAGALYKLTIPVDEEGSYSDNPYEWTFHRMFDSPAPITGAPSLSVDFLGNTFVFFGTGRYFSRDDKSAADTQYLFGIKDPFYNRHLYGHGPPDNYYLNYGNFRDPITITDLFDGDVIKIVYPWGCRQAPHGDCSGVPRGQVGDIYDDGSCVCSYEEWTPETLEPFILPLWDCMEKNAGGCDDVQDGIIGETDEYHALHWRAIGVDDDACLGIGFGHMGGYPAAGDTDCVGEEVTPQNWACEERPLGNCQAAGVTHGDSGDILQDGGSCFCGYFVVKEGAEGGCDDIDFTDLPMVLSFPDINQDGSCLAYFVDSPTAVVAGIEGQQAGDHYELVETAREKDGWRRTLQIPGERSLAKPTILGGLTLMTSYVPMEDICAFGGESHLYALYFETGTANIKPVFKDACETMGDLTLIRDRLHLGRGMASSVGIHVGRQPHGKATGYIQQSTGVIRRLDLDPALSIRSGFVSWEESRK